MDEREFTERVARLERESRENPATYKLKVALLAALGFGVLGLVLLFAGFGIVVVAGLALLVVLTGGKGLVLLLKFGKLLVLLAAPLWMLLRASVSALFTRFPTPAGHEITRDEAPALFAAIDELRARMRGPKFHHVLVTDEMNAAVIQRPLLGLFGFPRNYLVLGLPLLESLSPQEALAVVAHEYGHLSGAHARFGAFIYRLRITWGAIHDTASQWQGFAGRALRRLIEWYAPFFNAYTFVLARANEYDADTASAELVSPAVTATALKRVNVAAAHYRNFMDRVYDGVHAEPAPPADVAVRWAGDAIMAPAPALATRWLSESLNRQASAFDTHPVLRARLAALPGESDRVEELPQPLAGPSAAAAWLGSHADRVRSAAQTAWLENVRDGWRERHEEIRSQRQRLAELRAMPAPSIDETAERLRLQTMLERDVDHVPEVEAFNVANPDHAPTLYLEGTLRLEREDETGLARLDRAIELDAEAVKPACERAFEFLSKRGDHERAESYASRWRQRDEWEARRYAELATLDPSHEFAPHDLGPEALAGVESAVRGQAKGLRRAWLVRRVLPTDPTVRTYVLVVELTWWARFRSRGPKIVDTLAAIEWPMHAFICSADGNKQIAKKVRQLGVEAVYVRG